MRSTLATQLVAVLLLCRYADGKRAKKALGDCLNGGVVETDNTYTCDCPSPFYGQNCEKDERNKEVCLNGGVMQRSGSMFYCQCPDTYFGPRCETKCPSTFELLDNGEQVVGCYKVLLSSKTWYDAPAACARFDRRARLAVVDTADKDNAVKARLITYTPDVLSNCQVIKGTATTSSFWFAGERQVHGDCSSPFVWKPTHGKESPMTYTGWAAGEPNCGNAVGKEPHESCLSNNRGENNSWNDLACDWAICSVCEIPEAE